MKLVKLAEGIWVSELYQPLCVYVFLKITKRPLRRVVIGV